MKFHWVILILMMVLTLVSCDLIPQPAEIPEMATVTLVDTPQEVEIEEIIPTQTPSLELTVTPPQPTFTPFPTEPSVEQSGEKDPVVESVDDDLLVFGVQPGSPISIKAWTYGCNWLGVAGQVFNKDGIPVESIVVEAGGSLDDQPILGLSLTGRDTVYGPGGYEIQLLGHTIPSTEEVWIQLKDAGGIALSPKIYLDTYDECDRNLIILNFTASEIIPDNVLFIPIMGH